MKKLVIIPAYNEEESIKSVVQDIKTNAPGFDFIVINDASKDMTLEICRENAFPYIDMPINSGIGNVIQTGYKFAVEKEYDIVIQFDGDGQHDASYLPKLIKPIAEGEADFVIGSRFINKEGFQTSFFRRLGVRVFRLLILSLTGKTITDATSGFRAAAKTAIQFLSENYATDYPEPESIISLIKNEFKLMEIPVIMRERFGGKSSINLIRSVYYMFKVVLAVIICSIKPKQIRKEA